MAISHAERIAPLGVADPARSVSILSLAGAELRIGVRSVAFRLVVVLAAAIGWSAGAAPGRGAALSVYNAGEAAWRYYGLVVIGWMAILAVSDAALRTEVLVLSKPQPSEKLLLGKFIGAFGQVLLALAALFVAAGAARLYESATPLGFAQFAARYAAVAGVLFFAAAAAFTLAALARTLLAGAVVGLYWVLAIAGRNYVPKFCVPAYTQNLSLYVPLGIGVLGIALMFYRASRRGNAPAPLWVKLTAPAGLLVAVLGALHIAFTGYDPQVRTQPGLDEMGAQNLTMEQRCPGFRLPDENGRLTSLSDYRDHIFVIALFTPGDLDSAEVLSRLENVAQKYGSRGVQPIAICLSEDTAMASVIARGDGLSYPVVSDWGTHNAEKPMFMSPIAAAYQLENLPTVVVTDRRRRVRALLANPDAYTDEGIRQAVEDRLRDEPETAH